MRRRKFINRAVVNTVGVIAVPEIFHERNWSGIKSSSKKIKIGQIGVCHEHAGGRMNTLKQMSDLYEIVGVVDDRDSTAARFAGDNLKPYEDVPWMTEEELFNVPGLQAVMVETANSDLVPTAIRCMERNFAIAMDKPGGEDLKLFGELLKGCRNKNLPFQMGYMLRSNPAIQFCQKAVRENWLGDIFEIQASMSHNYGGESYQRFLSAFDGGIMFNLGCHHIDLVISMLGRPEMVIPILGATTGAVDGVKNNGLVVLQYPHAVVSIHVCDQEVDGVEHRRLKICGTKGTIELCPIERFDGKPLLIDLRLKEGIRSYQSGSHVIGFGVQQDRYEGQLLEFAKIVQGDMQNPYTYEHDYLTQEVHLAASGYIK